MGDLASAGVPAYTWKMRKSSRIGGGNGLDQTNALLVQVVNEITALRKEMNQQIGALRSEMNERFDRLIDLIAPRLKDHEERLTRLEDPSRNRS